MKKILSLALMLFLLVGLLPLVAAQEEDDSFSLTIMHTNDEHAGHEPDSNGDGGAAREKTVVDQIRAEVENSLLLDGGDRFTGSLFHQYYLGQDNAQIMNMIGYNAMTLGNHEFDNGDEILAAFIDALNFPVVTANVDFSESPVLAGKVAPYVVMEVGGEQIGIIGLVTPETDILSSPGKELVFEHDLVNVTQTAVDELTAMGVNKIILLTHIGINADMEVGQAVSGVDVIVGGHTHTLLSNTYTGAYGEYPMVLESATGEPVLVVQASTKTLYLGRLDVVFDGAGVLTDWEGDTILLSRYISPDPDVSDLIAGLAAPLQELSNTIVGESAIELDGSRETCRFAECTMGNLIADAIRESTGVDIALQNGGGIRASIDAGEVTLGEVLSVLPFGNLTSTFEISGADVIAAMENSVSRAENTENEGTGRFLQVSGLRYSWDGSKPAGERIVSVEVLGEDGAYTPIDPDTVYRVAINDFNRKGGDEFTMFAENAIDPYDFGTPLDVILEEYITAHSPVSAQIEGRITRVDQ